MNTRASLPPRDATLSAAARAMPDATRDAVRNAVLTAAILGVISTLGATLYLVTQGLDGNPLPLPVALSWQSLQYAAWIPVAGAIGWMLARGVQRNKRLWILLLHLTLFGAFAIPAHGLAAAFATQWMRAQIYPGNAGAGIAARVLNDLPTQILQYWALVAALLLLASRTRLREREHTAARLEADLNIARLEQLRARLQPHFLFNTLQSIAMLIPKEPESAQRMTIQLGDLLRASLRNSRADESASPSGQMVTLRDELAFLRCYLDIEAQRFRDRLRVEWYVDEKMLDVRVPDLLLQPLAENALKHGLWPSQSGGVLRIAARAVDGLLNLSIEDSGVGLPPSWHGSTDDGVGISVTRARLHGLYSDAATLTVDALSEGGTRSLVRIPIHDQRPRGATNA